MADPRATTYDVVPYENLTFFDSHPDRLAAVATLFGMTPPPVDRARVLELGCAGGGNLVPMAVAAPEGRFTGIDLSPRQVADAKGLAGRLGLGNVALHAMSFTDLGDDFGEFDYIIANGLYSWITLPLQEALLGVIRRHLAPDGVAFVSYNTFPGWHARGMVRELMFYHARGVADPLDRVREGRAILAAMGQITEGGEDVPARIIKGELARVRGQADYYVLHEYLEPDNNPAYYHDFVAKAAAQGLQPVADAQYRTLAENQPPQVVGVLDRLAGDDTTAREQYFDFLCNRYFRRTLLAHAAVPLRRPAAPGALQALRVSSLVGPGAPRPDPFSTAFAEFRAADGRSAVSTEEPPLKMALLVLTESWPRSVPFVDLRQAVRDRLARGPAPIADDPGALAEGILRCYAANVVDLHAHEPPFATEVSERPTASPLARIQAEAGPKVTNLRHCALDLTPFDRAVLRRLDGRRDRPALLDALAEDAARDAFPLLQDGRPVAGPPQIREALGKSLDPSLRRLAVSALLVG